MWTGKTYISLTLQQTDAPRCFSLSGTFADPSSSFYNKHTGGTLLFSINLHGLSMLHISFRAEKSPDSAEVGALFASAVDRFYSCTNVNVQRKADNCTHASK